MSFLGLVVAVVGALTVCDALLLLFFRMVR